MTNEEKLNVFKRELSFIKNQDIRDITEELIKDVPDYFFEIPASSTGKYHPNYALGKGGLVRHTKAAVLFANILSIPNPFNFTSDELDICYAALILHDSRKSGISDEAKSQYSRFDHPLLAANAVKNYFNFTEEFLSVDEQAKQIQMICNNISNAIASHMGQWNTSSYNPDIILPLPETNIQKFVHMCDYLASRKELDITNLC